MIEERILRLNEAAFEQLKDAMFLYTKSYPAYQLEQCLTNRTKLKMFYCEFDDLEPAPINDNWRPLCFEENADGNCDIHDLPKAYDVDDDLKEKHCNICAWRKERK